MMLKFAIATILLVALVCAAPSKHVKSMLKSMRSANKTIVKPMRFADATEDWAAPNVITTLNIGTPEQKFTLQMDLDFDDLLLRGPQCNSISCKGDGPTERKTYDTKSTTAKDQGDAFKVKYGTTVNGEYYTDNVKVDGIADTEVPLGILKFASTKFYNIAADGVFGLSFLGTTRGKKNLASPVDSILKGATKKIVNVWYNRATSNANRYGTLTFGKINSDNCSSDIQYSLVDDDFAFMVQKVRYMTFTAHRELKATIKPDSPTVQLPTTVYKDFMRTATGSATQDSTSCTKINGITLDIKIGGVFYSLKAEDITYKNPQSPTYCKFYVSDIGDEESGYILGEPFYRRYCTTYDVQNKQIGFSATK